MPERIQRKRTKGWKMPPNTVFVGRPTKGGNPFIVGAPGRIFLRCHYPEGLRCTLTAAYPHTISAKDAVEAFEAWLRSGLGNYWVGEAILASDTGSVCEKMFVDCRQQALSYIKELRGKNLACFCALDQPCHADALLVLANR